MKVDYTEKGLENDSASDAPEPTNVPSFVHFLPCTRPEIKYLDRLEGCATGLHVTREDLIDLHVFYGRMAEAIAAKDVQPVGEASPEPCTACKALIVPGPSSPILYVENCVHPYHYGCFVGWPQTEHIQRLNCPRCGVSSSRAILWPQVFPSEAAKNEHFQIQKRSFGIDVSPQTILQVIGNVQAQFPIFRLVINEKHLTVRKLGSEDQPRPLPALPGRKWTEKTLFQEIQRLHLAEQPRPFFLGDILPIEENAKYQAQHGAQPELDDVEFHEKILFQFQCPFDRVNKPSGGQCAQGNSCEFFHGWPEHTPKYIVERVKVRDFPHFFCLNHSRVQASGPVCTKRLRLHSEELVRCLAGFHPSTQDLKDIDGFARQMAKQILEPPIVPEPEPHLICALCHQAIDGLVMHLQDCHHVLHVQCVPLVRRNNPNRTLRCPTCRVPSARTIAWPGPFRSAMVKCGILASQLILLNLTVRFDMPFTIAQMADQPNVFTLDYGAPTGITIDSVTARNNSTITYE